MSKGQLAPHDYDEPAVYGFMHVATCGRWKEVVAEQLALLHSSGLYRRTTRLFVGIVGADSLAFDPVDAKIEVVRRSTEAREYEFPTLRFLQSFCQLHDGLVYYVHTKGVWHDTPATADWRRYMQHFVIERHTDCIAALRTHDTCGVNWSATPWPHFSGNFWWARADYVRRLPPVDSIGPAAAQDPERRHDCERWIGSLPGVRAACLHRSGVNHYVSRYPPQRYSSLRVQEPCRIGGSRERSRPMTDVVPRLIKSAAPRVAAVFDNVVRPDTTGTYCLEALRQLTGATHLKPDELPHVPPGAFDLYLYIDDGLDYELPPALRPSAMWAIDTHLDPGRLTRRTACVDFVFAAQRDGVDLLRSAGINCVGWLPLACDPAVHRKHDVEGHYDVCFVGHCATDGRRQLADLIRGRFPRSFIGQRYFHEMAATYSASRIVLNLSVRNDVNMRVFEALGCGTLLLTNDLTQNGLAELFRDGEHLITYGDAQELTSKIEYYLAHDAERERIAAAGRALVLSRHTYLHRMTTILDALGRDAKPREAVVARPPPHTSSTGEFTSIVIPVFNQLAYTRECVDSVRRNTPSPFELIVVDNGSTDGTSEYFKSRPDVKLVRNEENRGFAAAVNQGIAQSAGAHVVLLNNDTIVTAGWIERLLSALNTDTRIGLVGPCSNNVPGPQFVSVEYDRNAPVDEIERFARSHAQVNAGRIEPARVLGGFCLIVRRSVLERVGNFDEEFGIGTYDDYEFCHRAARAGFRAVIACDAFVHHFGAVTLGGCGVDVPGLLARNEALFRLRCAGAAPRAHQGAPVDPEEPLTSIVIVTFNAVDYTKLCLASVRRCTPEPHEVIVVDNGSTDSTLGYVRSMPGLRLIENRTNRGFPAAANQGIAAARGEQILLLNNDTVVTPGWLARLIRALKSSPEVGLVGPCSNCVSGVQRVEVDYSELTELDGFAGEWSARHEGELHEADRLVGFCMLFRAELVDRIGTFDERFGIGNFEDDDFCHRISTAGLRLVVARDCFVHHYGSISFKNNGVDYARLMETNRRLFAEKWGLHGAPPAPWNCDVSAKLVGPTSEGHRPRVSLCMIVRDSSRTLRPCLESIRPWVDEMLVVDTGSVDGTPRIAEELGARLRHFPWCDDFAAARNCSLEGARGEWLFWMDSDDTIDGVNGRKLRELAERPHPESTLGFVMQVRCPAGASGPYATDTVVDHVKLFRNAAGIRFSGRIHEQVLPAIRRAGGNVEWTDIFVTHSGSDTTPGGRARKHDRDLRLLSLELADDPDNTFTLFNIGMTFLDMGRPADALDPLCRSLQLSSAGESHVRKIYAMLAQAYSGLGRLQTAAKACAQGLVTFPRDPELLFRRGVLEHALGEPDRAEESFRAIIEMNRERHFSSLDQGILGIKVWHNLAIVHECQGRHELAAAAWQRVLEYDQKNSDAWRGLVDALTAAGDLAALDRTSARILGAGVPPEVASIARARALAGRGDPAAAVAVLEADDAKGHSVALLRELCELAFRNDLLDVARRGLGELVRRLPRDASAFQNLAAVHMRLGEYDQAIRFVTHSLQLRPGHRPAEHLLEQAERFARAPARAENSPDVLERGRG